MLSCCGLRGNDSERVYDFIIFGATGHLGKQVLTEAVTMLSAYNWAIAGRSLEKLEGVLQCVSAKIDYDLSEIPIFLADINDPLTLNELASRCQVLINCCGPYYLLGEQVIRACIEEATDYVDVCNETPHIDLMKLRYDAMAKNVGAYVVLSCGHHSLLIDVGVNYLESKFNGSINSIDAYTEILSRDEGTKLKTTAIMSKSGWSSFVMSFANFKQVGALRRELMPLAPKLKPLGSYKRFMGKSDVPNVDILMPFPLMEQQIVESTQYCLYAEENRRPIQFFNYLVFSSAYKAFAFFIWCFVIAVLAQVDTMRDILMASPVVFSLGLADKCPDMVALEQMTIRITLKASGWSSVVTSCECEDDETQHATAVITGRSPFYGMSCVCLLTSAIVVFEQRHRLPEYGGVLSPGFAFRNTSIIEELQMHPKGPRFSVCKRS